MKIAIIGAGMAGLACAEALAGAGQKVTLFDKGRGPGGRMSTRRVATDLGEAGFDHGAQYFTVRDAGFKKQVARWIDSGVVALWPAAGPDAFVGVSGMNAPIRAMADGQTVHWSALVTGITWENAGWNVQLENQPCIFADRVVCAVPAEQAATMLKEVAPHFSASAAAARSEPCWTAMLAFEAPLATPIKVLRDDTVLGWAADNRCKPGRTGPASWVLQASPNWSRQHLEQDAAWILDQLKQRLAECLQISLPKVISQSVHRWRYARSGSEGSQFLLDASLGLGVCGDWLIGPRVEAAWLSGHRLAQKMMNL